VRLDGGTVRRAGTALRGWDATRWAAAALATVLVALLVGVPTVLVPNPWFGREIPVQPWNYPVWAVTAVLSGLLVATYVRPTARGGARGAAAADGDESRTSDDEPGPARASAWGTTGAVAAWFAVGCPVCNKLALLALGYGGALTWFAPAQPVLAALALVLSAWALVARLGNEVACSLPRRATVAR